ncbi:MAG: hypothetical protein H3C47_16455 [Candidatus Cloacimonetes bacterium]|nr:hypothetical protein [Candidatus Cloacimonadota bacterium]
MSIEIVKSQIRRFLSNDQPDVLAIKGPWGTGKTYSWNKFLLSAKLEGEVLFETYSYVSLFGVNSLEAFKQAILASAVSRELIGEEPNNKTLMKNVEDFFDSPSKGKKVKDKAFGWLTKLPEMLEKWKIPFYKDWQPLAISVFSMFAFYSINKWLICVDDLERRGSGLSMKDALGLVSQLKEQKKCKIVLILNENEDGLEDLRKYKEKVIDVELMFDTTPQEAAEIAYGTGTDIVHKLAISTKKLEIKNIRVLKKIERLATQFCPLLTEYEQEVTDVVWSALVLYSFCYYCEADGAPSLEFVRNLQFSDLASDNKKHGELERSWLAILNRYGKMIMEELDHVIADSVMCGYIDEDKFRHEAAKKNSEIVLSKSLGSYGQIWEIFHDSFDENKDQLIQAFSQKFTKDSKHLDPRQLNEVVGLFKGLGEAQNASEIIAIYIEQRGEETELFNINRLPRVFQNQLDQEIVEKFNKKYQDSVMVESLADVLNRIDRNKSWSDRDVVILSNTPSEDYYDLFKNTRCQTLSSYIETCLKFGKLDGSDVRYNDIRNAVEGALKRIGAESPLNKLRVAAKGVV